MKHELLRFHFAIALFSLSALSMIGCADGGEPEHIVRSRDGGSDIGQDSDQGMTPRDGGVMTPTTDSQVGPPTDSTVPEVDGGSGNQYLREVPDALAPAFGDAICGYLERCELKTLLEAVINEPCAQFLSRQFRDATVARLEGAVREGSIGFDPSGAQACLSAFDALECTPDFEALAMSCLSGFVGQLGLDEACSHHEECVTGHFCAVDGECPGQCAALSETGEPCTDPAGCVAGSSCVQGTCQLPVPEGEVCGGNGPACEAGLFCDGENGGRGRCRVFNSDLVGENAMCEINGGPLCEAGLACVTVVNAIIIEFRCRPRVGLDEVCHPGLPDQCEDGLYCAGTNIMSFPPDLDGRCEALPGAGEPCGSAPAFEVCGPGLVCDDGTCAARSALGDACQADATCYSGKCAEGVCVTDGLCGP